MGRMGNLEYDFGSNVVLTVVDLVFFSLAEYSNSNHTSISGEKVSKKKKQHPLWQSVKTKKCPVKVS